MSKNIVLIVRPSSKPEALELKGILEQRLKPCSVNVFTSIYLFLMSPELGCFDGSIHFIVAEQSVPLLGDELSLREIPTAIKTLEALGLKKETWVDTHSIRWLFHHVLHSTKGIRPGLVLYTDREPILEIFAQRPYYPLTVIKKAGRQKKRNVGALIRYLKIFSRLRGL